MERYSDVRGVQEKILQIIKYIDVLCRTNGIVYYLMGGTALGAVRHGGFIPWDDDLDIFMTPDQYKKFKAVFEKEKSAQFVLQEWKTTPDYLEYAKVRMNGTTFIEHQFRECANLHQGIYVDIMILHKVPENYFIQKLVYYESKYVTLYGIAQRGWKAKNRRQAFVLKLVRVLPNRLLLRLCYRRIYRYDNMERRYRWCYWITKAGFRAGLFAVEYFSEPIDVPFEDTKLMGSRYMKEYLEERYGDYMCLPSLEEQKATVHAEIFDTEKDYAEYIIRENK